MIVECRRNEGLIKSAERVVILNTMVRKDERVTILGVAKTDEP